jgi:membrane protein YdbS with pleckstrin-like domain
MADSLELILQVCPAPGDDTGELAELAGWLRGEVPGLDVQGSDWLPAEAVPVGAKGSADIAGLLLVQLDPKALQIVLAKVADWMARSDRVVEVSAGGHALKLGLPTHQVREKVVDGSLVPGTEVSLVRLEGESEAAIEVAPSVAPNRDSSALEPSKALVLRESLPLIRQSPRERSELSRTSQLADARLLVKGRINIATRPGQEFRRTAAFAGISSLFGSGLIVLLSIIILAIAKHYHGFSISTSYPVHRVYQDILRYIVRVTPPPGSSHMLLVYTVYLAVLPVLFAVVFMHLKVGSSRLFVAAVACVVFMAAPFIIVITSIRAGSTNCGSWNYPELNSGSECYNALAIDFRIAFAAGVVGLALPIIYLIRGKNKSLLLRALEACASVVMALFRFISYIAQIGARGGRDGAADQNAEATVGRYLLPHEREVIIVRRHPAILIGPSVLVLVWAVAAVVLTATILRGNEPLVTAVWIAWLVLFVRMIWKAINWTGTFFAVTSQRLLLISGALTKKAEMLPLTKVTDMSFQRSFTGRLLGFGEFIIESAGADRSLQTVDYIPFPEQLYLEVCGLIFMPSDIGDSDD